MKTPGTIRRWIDLTQWSRRGFLLAILMLGAGVFLWGTAYKLSLYESSPIHNKVPVAKLSTQASTANKDKVVSATTPRDLTVLSLLLNLMVLLFALSAPLRCSAVKFLNQPLRRLPLYFPPASFLRPPPFPLYG